MPVDKRSSASPIQGTGAFETALVSTSISHSRRISETRAVLNNEVPMTRVIVFQGPNDGPET